MTSTTQKPLVFISYASPYEQAARTLQSLLREAFALDPDNVFLAPTSISASPDGHDNFVRAITRNALDAEAFVIVATRDYSTRFWCRYEVLLRDTLLRTSDTPGTRTTPQWFPLWIDRGAEVGREFGNDEFLRLTGLTTAQGYCAWKADDMNAILRMLAELLQKPEVTCQMAAKFKTEMERFVTDQNTPEMALKRFLGGLKDSVIGVPLPEVLKHQHIVDGAVTLTPGGVSGGRIVGLAPDVLAIDVIEEPFEVDQALQAEYRAYFDAKTNDPGRYWDASGNGDGDKFMLTSLPFVNTDHMEAGGRVYLKVRPVKYSQVLFYQDKFLNDPRFVANHLNRLCDIQQVDFPSILCLHTVVVTSDEQIVVVRRSPSVHYYPGKYAATIEEQFHARKDIVPGPPRTGSVQAWVYRALDEEMSLIPDTHFEVGNVRILSVFLEHTLMNLSVCALVRLGRDGAALRDHLANNPRADFEFDRTQLFSCDDALQELRSPSLTHHPTSRYRLLMALLCLRGNDWLKNNLADLGV